MRPPSDILFRALRHTLVGVAVLAVLSMAIGLHAHDPGTPGHGASSAMSATWAADGQDPGDPGLPDPDPDAGDACDCPCQTVHPPHGTVFDPAAAVHRLSRPQRHDIAPEHVSYPPDPPPARLS